MEGRSSDLQPGRGNPIVDYYCVTTIVSVSILRLTFNSHLLGEIRSVNQADSRDNRD